jgi:hypothetical protein
MGRHSWLCLLARSSRLGLRKRSGVTRRGHLQVASMAQRQPNVVNVRNGPSRGRSRSISRSRSRSRSRSPSPGVRMLPQAPKHGFPEPTAFVMMQSQSDIIKYTERKVTLTYNQVHRLVRTGEVGPKTRFAIELLFNAAFIAFISPGTTFEHDAAHPFPVENLAKLCSPATMPLPTLVHLIYSVYEAEAAAEAAAPAAAPATTQGYVQQQPSLLNPTLLGMQQELDEQMRSDPWLRHLA